MKTHVRAAVIGGGVVGCSVLYHLARLGWTESALFERSELTSGSTWHAAGGMHTINGDVNMSHLQAYTVRLYAELEKESGQSCGIHRVGCLYVAASPLRHEFFRAERSKARHLGLDLEFVSLAEARRINPLMATSHVVAALFDPNDGHVDPSGVTQAYAKAARARGAEIYRHTPVIELKPTKDGHWDVVTPRGTVRAEVVVNAAGLWAREVGRMAGVRVPVIPMEHQYIVTNRIQAVVDLDHEIPMTIDFEGESYLRQEGHALVIGTYEHDCRHWGVQGTPPDFGHELLPADVDRMADGLAVALERYPCLKEGGVKRVVNGGMVFAPDGNPTIGPVKGLPGYFLACGVMAGFSQGGGVGLAVAQWIVDGEPGVDVYAMDVARFGDHVTDAYVLEKTTENYRRRFAITCPNEELPAARPLRASPVHPRLAAEGAVFGATWGWEYPLWYAPAGTPAVETPSFRRSNAHGPVAEECRAVRTAVGLWETSTYSKFEIAGPKAEAWLDGLVANRLPAAVGRTTLCPMLSRKGRLFGDVTVTRTGPETFLMVGSAHAVVTYGRWFQAHRPPRGVAIRDRTVELPGFAVAGPRARELLAAVTGADVSPAALPFLASRRLAIGLADALVIRIGFTGELGYEIYVAPELQLHVWERLREAGEPLGLRLFGARALNSLRLEKGYGAWSREYTLDYTPREAGLGHLVKPDKGRFVGRAAAVRDAKRKPKRRLVLLEVDARDADCVGGEAVLRGDSVVGRVTSGGYGHWVGKSLALAYVTAPAADELEGFAVDLLGDRLSARRLGEPPHDPAGARMRG
jgi:dimethylglycine dehydrogenase